MKINAEKGSDESESVDSKDVSEVDHKHFDYNLIQKKLEVCHKKMKKMEKLIQSNVGKGSDKKRWREKILKLKTHIKFWEAREKISKKEIENQFQYFHAEIKNDYNMTLSSEVFQDAVCQINPIIG